WHIPKKLASILDITTPRYWPSTTQGFNEISRRIDLLWNRDDIVKEHAKLVQDINSLKQVMYVAPVAEERDYEDSVFPDIIETFSSTTTRPTTTRSRPSKTGFPVLLLGGGSRRHSTKSQPPKVPKKTISLVGTSSPIVRHPYPFVMAASSHQPVRICMSSPLTYSTTTRRPSLWERLVRAIIPR
ncbi:jg27221, partial [Pararge aegeria aegeria]